MALKFGKPIPLKKFLQQSLREELDSTGGRYNNQRINEWLDTHPDQVLPVRFPKGEDRRKFAMRIMNAVRYRHPHAASESDETYLYIRLTSGGKPRRSRQ